MTSTEWNEVNSLLRLLDSFKVVELVAIHYEALDNTAPSQLLSEQMDKVQSILNMERR